MRITPMYPTTVNDESLTAHMAPVLKRAADGQLAKAPLSGTSEDFSFFAQAIPGLLFLGVPAQSGSGYRGTKPQPTVLC